MIPLKQNGILDYSNVKLVHMLILKLSFNKLIYTARQILSNVFIAVFILAISQMDMIGYNGK